MMEFHEVSNIFPLMVESELAELANDIAAHGQIDPIIIYEDKILDGRNRYLACELCGVDPDYHEFKGNADEVVPYVISLNLKRRHLTESQRAMVAANIANLKVGKPSNSANLQNMSSEDAAELLSVGVRSVSSARKVKESGSAELIDAVTSGQASVSAAADIADLPVDEQSEIVARGEDEILRAAKNIRQLKSLKRREELVLQRAEMLKVKPPAGTYRTIVIDPPWDMKKIERDVTPEQVEFEYPTMTIGEITQFPVPKIAYKDCHIYLWTTQRFLPDSFDLLDQWGFNYIFTMVWHKNGGFQPYNLPQYNCEFVLFGKRGSLDFMDTKRFSACFNADRREHSRKPEEFYDLVSRVSPGPRIDVFSREPREGFDQYGDESAKYN